MSLKKIDGDDTGMQTRVWGPAGWLFLHSIAQNYPWEPTEEKKREYLEFFKLVGSVLPCRYCRESYIDFITQSDTLLSMDTMKDRKTLITWLYDIHNKVNEKLEVKDIPTLSEVFNKYESYRSKCKKSPELKPKKGCLDPLKGLRKRCFINIIPVDQDGNKFGTKKINKATRIKLVSITKSKKADKKLTATFLINGKKRIIHFGQKNASDYTKHKDTARRKRYIQRHLKDLHTKNPAKAGYLSMFILWNKKNLESSIADYRRRLNIYNKTGKFPTKLN